MKFEAPVLLVGNGPVDAQMLALATPHCPYVVAADGGANTALAQGLRLAATLGDMDSATLEHPTARYGKIVQIAEQSTTDFEKCLARLEAPLFLGAGFLGGRLDHELAALNAVVKASQNVVLLGQEDLVFKLPDVTKLSLPIGTRFSTFPLGTVRDVNSEGLAWPLDGLKFAPNGGISTSNRTAEPIVAITHKNQPLLCILPRAHLAATLKLFIS